MGEFTPSIDRERKQRKRLLHQKVNTKMTLPRATLSLLLLQYCSAFYSTAPRQAWLKPNVTPAKCLFMVGDQEAAEAFAAAAAELEVEYEAGSHEELMYAFGVSLGRQLGDIRPLVNDGDELTILAKGVLDVVIGRLDEVEVANLLIPNKERLSQILTERTENIKQRLQESGDQMLGQMKETEGAFTLESGVVVHPLEPGPDGWDQGPRPTPESSVKVHYHGTLPDGTVFDSSLGRDPATFSLDQVIPGWNHALQNMCEGETAMIGIPPDMGYGEQGSPDGRIPGGATLFFKVQLLEVLAEGSAQPQEGQPAAYPQEEVFQQEQGYGQQEMYDQDGGFGQEQGYSQDQFYGGGYEQGGYDQGGGYGQGGDMYGQQDYGQNDQYNQGGGYQGQGAPF